MPMQPSLSAKWKYLTVKWGVQSSLVLVGEVWERKNKAGLPKPKDLEPSLSFIRVGGSWSDGWLERVCCVSEVLSWEYGVQLIQLCMQRA